MRQTDPRNSNIQLSIVVPLFNEEDSVEPLYDAITSVLKDGSVKYELILVDDGSTDRTYSIARELGMSDPQLRVIKFRKNTGQTAAMAAGIDHASGHIIVTMDGDLQNDPADIPKFIDKISEGYDIVVGWRHRRKDTLVTRKIPSWIANWLIGKVTGVPIKDNGCSLKAYRADVIKEVPLYSEMHRFIPAMASITGANISEIKVKHHARKFGQSKYGLSRTYKVLLDLLSVKTLISFASRPLHWFALIAAPFLALGIVASVSALYQSAASTSDIGTPMAGTALLFFALVIFLLGVGLLCDLIYRFGDLSLERYYRLTAANFGAGTVNAPQSRRYSETSND